MSRSTPISAAAMAHAGWTRVDPRPWSKTTARWRHVDGWHLEHCGHPTALWPWALYSSDGAMHVAYNGRAWPDLASVAAYVRDGAEAEPAPLGRRRALAPYLHGERLRTGVEEVQRGA